MRIVIESFESCLEERDVVIEEFEGDWMSDSFGRTDGEGC